MNRIEFDVEKITKVGKEQRFIYAKPLPDSSYKGVLGRVILESKKVFPNERDALEYLKTIFQAFESQAPLFMGTRTTTNGKYQALLVLEIFVTKDTSPTEKSAVEKVEEVISKI